MYKTIFFPLFHGPHSGYTVMLIVSIVLTVRACYVDVFIDESESAPSDTATEMSGIKATRVTRPIMVGTFLLIACFSAWKIWQR